MPRRKSLLDERMSGTFEHWRQRIDEHNVCWLTLDRADASANTLSEAVLAELSAIVDALASRPLSGVVIESGKRAGFIVGADVKEFGRLESAAEGTELAGRGQAIMARIAALKVPTVAAIDGFALGGGLELALACDYRVVAEGYDRTLGLPEVQLGIHPGFGGTVRTVELIGPPAALDMMLTGRALAPPEALACGLVDKVVPRDGLAAAAADLVARRPPRRRAAWYLGLLNLRRRSRRSAAP